MPDESRSLNGQVETIPDFSNESRHEFVERLAYKLWLKRGQPLGSPDMDWFNAEQELYDSLVASGMITPSSGNPQNMREAIYHGG